MSEQEPHTSYGVSEEAWGDVEEGSAVRRFKEAMDNHPEPNVLDIAKSFGLTDEDVAALEADMRAIGNDLRTVLGD
jgi:hypothetical protein